MKKKHQSILFKDILTMTETELRLSFGITSNKTYHFQTTANHHRFIKVWTSKADPPTSIFFVQTFFFGKSKAQKYSTYLQLGHMSKILYFFNALLIRKLRLKMPEA